VQRELIAIQRAVGTTFVLVTHDQEEAMAMSDYIAVMDRGQIVQFGVPRALYESPRNRFVASFLGSINLFEGSAELIDSNQLLYTAGDGTGLRIPHEPGPESRNICAVGFRPERVIVSASRTDAANEWPGTIEQISYGGTVSRATIRLSSGRMLEATLMNAHSGAPELVAGGAVYVRLPSDAALILRE
jgi:putrescine transport system ATP-binding protein